MKIFKNRPIAVERFACLIVILNLIDATITMFSLRHNLATEINPMMNLFYELSPWAFLFVKLFLTFYFTFFVIHFKNTHWAFKTTLAIAAVFLILVAYQTIYLIVISVHMWN